MAGSAAEDVNGSGFKAGCGNGDEIRRKLEAAEFERLYREFFDAVHACALFRVRSEEVARDVTSEELLRAVRYIDSPDLSKAKFSTWASVIARNCLADHRSGTVAHVPLEDASETALGIGGDYAVRAADADLVNTLLATLSVEEREIVSMKYLAGLANVGIARELGMNPSTVGTKVQRALAKMPEAWNEGAW